MSRNIKTVECLSKHVGKTVKVVDDEGRTFLATVEEGPDLYTTDKKAADSTYWWMSGDRYGHHCRRYYQITEELKSLTLVSEKKAAKKPSKKAKNVEVETKKSFLTREQLLEHIGERCKMSDGTEGLILKTDMGNPRIIMNTRANGHGWPYSKEEGDDTGVTTSVKSQYKYAWNICDNDDAEDILVVEILADEKCAESSKTILDMTVREVLEKLNEIIISR